MKISSRVVETGLENFGVLICVLFHPRLQMYCSRGRPSPADDVVTIEYVESPICGHKIFVTCLNIHFDEIILLKTSRDMIRRQQGRLLKVTYHFFAVVNDLQFEFSVQGSVSLDDDAAEEARVPHAPSYRRVLMVGWRHGGMRYKYSAARSIAAVGRGCEFLVYKLCNSVGAVCVLIHTLLEASAW